jgi:PAS domain S-box-containing protein
MTPKKSKKSNTLLQPAEELHQLAEELETRKAELLVLNSIQEGIASGLDIDSIFAIAGERIAEIFPGEGIALYTYDPDTQWGEAKYILEEGVRHYPPPFESGPIGKKAAETKQSLVISTRAEFEAIGATTIQGTAPSLSGIYTPLIVNDRSVGALNIESTSQEHAFDDADIRLVTTIARSLSVALENARLLKATEERNAELAIINTVQRALAAQLDIQGIYEAVGEKLRQIFDSQTIAIYSADLKNRINTTEYAFEKGQKFEPVSQPFSSLHDHLITLNDTYVFNGDFPEFAAQFEDYQVSAGEMPKSLVGVPVFRKQDTDNLVTLTLQDIDGDKTFSDSDVRLLETLANSMSIALENARLFDETQHLLEETELRAAELATINAVGQALVAESELEAVIEMIGEKMRETFTAEIVYVALLDQESEVINFPYTYGEEFTALQLGEGLTSRIIQSGEPLLINKEMDKRRAEMGIAQVGVKARSYLGVPIQFGGQTFGVISIQSTSKEGRFDQNDLHLLSTIATNVGAALRNAQLFDQIKRQKQYYEAVIENSPAAIVLLDLKTNVTGWNPAAERLFGYSESEALGRNVDDLVAFSDELYAEAVRYSEKAMEEKQVHLLTRRMRKDRSLVEVEVSGLPVSVDGEYVGFIAIYHDVTELQRARQEAEEANRAKSTFLANMSHELRTPLNAIIGFSRIVRRKGEGVLPKKQVENLDKVLVSADHLLNLINTVLDISKIEAGRMDVQPTNFELPPLVELVVDTGQPLLREGVRLKIDVPSDLPEVFSDQNKLKQILINLLSNAAKFTHEGEITLASRYDGERLYIDVNDTGIGVSEDALSRIFEDFQQADSSTTREYGGTGLGLPISRSLARLLGGDLTACSIEGEGSTFTLTLPIRFKEMDAEPETAVEVEG